MSKRLAVCLFLVLSLGPAMCVGQSGQPFSIPAGVEVQAASVQGVPIVISNVSLRSDYGRNVSELSFQVANQSEQSFRALRFAAYYLEENGHILGADIFPAGAGLESGTVQSITVPIATTFSPGTRVIVTLSQVSTPAGTLTVAGKQLRQASILTNNPIVLQGQLTPAGGKR